TCSPTALLPVNDTLRTRASATMAWPTSAAPGTMLSTPAGTLAWVATSPSTSSGSSVVSDGLSTMVQPAASAGATFQAVVTMGKFHGTISAQTPAGSWQR